MLINQKLAGRKRISKLLILFALMALYCQPSIGQIQTDTVSANQYYHIGDSLSEASSFEASISYFEKAISIYEAAAMWKNVAHCYDKIAKAHRKSFNTEAIIPAAQKALEISTTKMESPNQEEAEAYLELGLGHYYKGDYPLALSLVLKTLAIQKQVFNEPHEQIASTYNTIGVFYQRLAKYDSARYYLDQSIELTISLKGEDNREVANAYRNLGVQYYFMGNYEQALNYTLRAIAIGDLVYQDEPATLAQFYGNAGGFYTVSEDFDLAQTYHAKALRLLGNKSHPNASQVHNNLGDIFFRKKQYDQALKHFFQALDNGREFFDEEHPKLARYHSNIGRSYGYQKKYDLAIRHLSQAEKSYSLAYGQDHPEVVIVQALFGEVYQQKSELDSALFYYRKGLRTLESRGDDNIQLPEFFNDIATIHYKKDQYDSAAAYYEKALLANLPYFKSGSRLTHQVLKDNLNPTALLPSMEGKAKSYWQQHKVTGELKYLQMAKSTYQLCDTMLVGMRQSSGSQSDKAAIGTIAAKMYEGAIRTSLQMATQVDDPQYLNQAFYSSEKSKAGALQDVLNNLHAKNFARLPHSLTDYERDLKNNRSLYHSSILQEKIRGAEQDSGLVEYYEDRLFGLNRSYDSLIASLEKNYPTYYQLKYQTQVITVEQAQKKLSPDEALLEYFWGDSSLYVFLLTRELFEIAALDLDSTLQQGVVGLRKAWDKLDQISLASTYENYTRYAHLIYQKVLNQPLALLGPSIKRLIVIPDGPLSYVPFDVLLTKAETGDYRDLPYLLRDYQIRYGYDATMLFDAVPATKKIPNRSKFLAFAPAYQGFEPDSLGSISLRQFRNQINALEWNQPEVLSIGNYLDGVPYLGVQAQEGQFKMEASKYGILHLAMHAFVDEENPMNSKFVFTKSNDSTEDGFLHTFEIYDMELNADLAVLSACNTGYGKLVKGEGVMSLSRAFSYAGVPSVVMSHWPVNDEAGAKLIALFYQKLSKGLAKDEALRQAKLEYLENANNITANPYFWGSFVLTGDPAPIPTNYTNFWIWGFFGLALVFSIGYLVARQNSK